MSLEVPLICELTELTAGVLGPVVAHQREDGVCRKRDDAGMEGLGDRNISEGIKRVPDSEQRVHERLML